MPFLFHSPEGMLANEAFMGLTMTPLLSFQSVSAALAMLSFILLFSPNAYTHHGWRGYSVDFDFEAMVSKTRYGNPHDQIWVVDAEGSEWNFLLAPPTRNRRLGFDETTVVAGQQVRLVGQREKSGTEGKVHFIYAEDGETLYTYYYGNGVTSWERSQR